MRKRNKESADRIEKIMLPENQGGEPTNRDYFWYMTLGLIFPAILLIWGWY